MTVKVIGSYKLLLSITFVQYLLVTELSFTYADKQCSVYNILIHDVSYFLNCIHKRCSKEKSSQDQMDSESTFKVQTSLAVVPYDESSLPIFHKEYRNFDFGNISIKIKQNWQESGVAAVVWDAAVVLGEYLYQHPHEVSQKQVIELGAGTGLAGILAAFLGAEVTLTDRDVALNNLQANVDLNFDTATDSAVHQSTDYLVKVKELSWGENLHKFQDNSYDVILCADIIYIEETFPLLLQTLTAITRCNTKVIISCKIRYERDHKFLNMMKEKFELSEILYDKARDIHLYVATKV